MSKRTASLKKLAAACLGLGYRAGQLVTVGDRPFVINLKDKIAHPYVGPSPEPLCRVRGDRLFEDVVYLLKELQAGTKVCDEEQRIEDAIRRLESYIYQEPA